jgi:hypothetical protein
MSNKIVRNCIALASGLMLLALIMSPLTEAQTNVPNIRVYLSGPSVIGTLRSGTYSATMVDPESRSWDYRVYITASNTTGASPLFTSPINGTFTPENQTITFDITAQQKAGELEIHINCTIGTLYYEKVQTIYVVPPITIEANVNNPTNVQIKNATVQFYVDGTKIDNQIIPTIGASQTTKVSTEWISKEQTPGWHDTRIVIDLNGDGIIDTHAGDMILDDRFYIQGETDWVFGITVLIGLLALILGMGYISKRKMK